MAVGTTTAIVLASIGAAGSIYGSVEQRRAGDKARRASRASEALERKRESLQLAKERRKQIREAQVQAAQIEASSAATGTSETSSRSQGVGSLRSRAGANISFLNQSGSISQAKSIFNVKAGRAQSDANRAATVSQVGQSLFSAALPFTTGGGGVGNNTTIEPNRPDSTFR